MAGGATKGKKPPAKRAPAANALDARERRFVDEYLTDLDPKRAALAAGYSATIAASKAYQWVSNGKVKPHVHAAVAAAQQTRSERTSITADQVLNQWWAIATADPNELIDLRRTCCRFCYGEGHLHQRTENERARDYAAWEARERKKAKGDEAEPEPFNEAGGTGYDSRLAPHPECPECFGEGIPQVFPKDSRNIPPAARLLYAGVKQTKDGLEIKMRDQDAALVNVAKHLGMFVEKVAHTGHDGGAIKVDVTRRIVRADATE